MKPWLFILLLTPLFLTGCEAKTPALNEDAALTPEEEIFKQENLTPVLRDLDSLEELGLN